MIELTETEIAQYYRVRVPGLRKIQGDVRGPWQGSEFFTGASNGKIILPFAMQPRLGRV